MRTTNNQVVKNASWIIGMNIAKSLLAFIIGIFTARYLGPLNYGLISYASSIVTFVLPIMQLGISNVLVRELVINKEREGEVLGTAIVLNLISALLCILGVYAFSLIANSGEMETTIVCVLYSSILVFQAAEVTQYWFQAKLLSKYSSIAAFCSYIVISCYRFFLLVTGKSVYWFALANSFDYCLIAISLFIIYKKLNGQRLLFSKLMAKRLFSKGKHYILSSMMVTIFAQTDKIMLKHMVGTAEVGYYSASATCAGIASFVFAAIIDSFRPLIFESKDATKEKFELNMARLYNIITYLALAQCIGMTLFAHPIILIIYGKDFQPAIGALRIIVWYTTFAYYGSVRNVWILAEEKQKYLWIINLSGAIANIVLNWLLIPVMSVNGAALASLVTQFFTNVVVGWIIKPIRKNNEIMLRGLKPSLLLETVKIMRKKMINRYLQERAVELREKYHL